MKTLITPFLLVVFWPLFGARVIPAGDVTAGTILVVNIERDRAVIAADSRATKLGSNGSGYSDQDCKVIPMDDSVVFSSTGLSEYTPTDGNDPVPHWQAEAEAKRILKGLVKSSRTALPLRLAVVWGYDTGEYLNNLGERNRPLLERLIAEHQIPQAVIAGVTPSGALQIERIYFPIGSGARPVFHRLEDLTTSDCASRIGNVCGFGQSNVVDEYRYLRTDRARSGFENWKKRHRKMAENARAVALAKFLVQVTIEYDKTNQVGGAIDVLELKTGRRKIRWIQRKASCKPATTHD